MGRASGHGCSAGPAAWDGWLDALDDELRAADGMLPWTGLRDALVARYCRLKHKEAHLALDKTLIGLCALASVPASYLSKEDHFVRLPIGGTNGDAVADEHKAKRRKLGALDQGAAENCQSDAAGPFKIHVGGLPFSARETAIREYFGQCGPILECDLLTTHSGSSRGIAFVVFATVSALDAALQFNDAEFDGRRLKVSKATGHGRRDAKGKGKGKKGKSKDKGDIENDAFGKGAGKDSTRESREFEVFVGGLPYGVSEDGIRKDFGDCGETGRFHIPLDEEGNHKGIAFINFLTREGMEKALEFDDQEYGGVWIRVQKAGADRVEKGKSKGKALKEP